MALCTVNIEFIDFNRIIILMEPSRQPAWVDQTGRQTGKAMAPGMHACMVLIKGHILVCQ